MGGDELELRIAWQHHVGSGHDADRWFADVVARHREPWRHYHDLRHVRWVVHHVRRLAVDAVDPPLPAAETDAVVAAAYFHDAVYDARRSDNEAVSARLAERALAEIGWPTDRGARVARLVEATAHAMAEPATPDADPGRDVLIAADLGVLATEPAPYGDYVRGVRREYAHLDDDAWRAGRASFVSQMLGRPHLFPTGLALDTWERRARANLTAELAALQG